MKEPHSAQDPKESKPNDNQALFKKIDSEEFSDQYDTRKLYLGVWRHLILIVLCGLLFAAGGYWANQKFSNTYEAQAVVLYHEKEDAPEVLEGAFNLTNFTISTVLEIIKTPKHLEAVKTRLGLDMDLEAIGNMIKIPTPRSESNLIRIIARADNPNLAVDVANSLAQAAVRDNQEYTRKQLRETLENIRYQLGVIQRSMVSQLSDIENFKKKNQFFEMDPRAAKILEEAEYARQAREKAVLEYQSLLEQYESLKRQTEALPDYVPIDRESTNSPLQVRIISLETQLAEARGRYTPDNPKVRQMENELQELMRKSKNKGGPEEESFYERNALKDQLSLELLHMQGKVTSAKKVMEQVEQRLQKIEEQLQTLPVKQMELVKLLQLKDITEEQVRYMARAAETTQLMVNMPKGSVQLYQLAQKATPWKEGLWVDFLPLIGFLFGAGVGVCLAILLEMFDSRLCTSRQLDMYYSVPCLSSVPELPALTRKNVNDRMLFFVRQVVEVIERMIAGSKTPVNIVNFASSVTGEGKTTFAYLVAKYQNDLGKSTLLLELDWRKNPWETSSESKGLTDYLEGNASFDDILSETPFPRISVQKQHPRMKELLKSEKMKTFLDEARQRFPMMTVDSPGVIEEDYATNIAEAADATLLFIGSSKVPKAKVDVTLSTLDRSGVRPFGIVLNRIKSVYVDDERLKLEAKKSNRQLFRWRKKTKTS